MIVIIIIEIIIIEIIIIEIIIKEDNNIGSVRSSIKNKGQERKRERGTRKDKRQPFFIDKKRHTVSIIRTNGR